MYNIIPLILILASLSVIIVITIRKFPVLANLDLENIPAEKEAKFKERIISDRLKRNYLKWKSKVVKLTRPVLETIKRFLKWVYKKSVDFKDSYKKVPGMSDVDIENRIALLLDEAEEAMKKEDINTSEKKLIEIIGLDNKHKHAFKLLGKLYLDKKSFEESRQIFEYLLKLENEKNFGETDPIQISQTFFDLALVYEAMGSYDKAFENVRNALDIEPNNPRFLDTMLEISIIKKDKVFALDAYDRLAAANPDNQKLEEFKRQISEL